MGTPPHWDSPPGGGTEAPATAEPAEADAPSEIDASPHGDAHSLSRSEVTKRSLSGVFFLTFSNVASMAIGFLASLVLARLLVPADFGTVAVGSTATLLGAAIADGGLGVGMVRRPKPPTRAELKTMNGIQLAISLALCVPTAAVALGFGQVGAVTALMVMSLPIMTLQTPGRITLTRAMRYDRQVAADAGSTIISQLFAVVAVVLGAGVWGLAFAAVVKAILATTMLSALGSGFLLPSLRGWREFGGMLLFGAKFQASFYTFVAREQGLNILLAVTAGVHVLGIWTFTNRVFQLPSLAFTSLYVVGFPAMAAVIARGEDVRPLLLKIVRRAAIIGTLTFATFAAASPKLIPAVFGDQWKDAAAIIPFNCLSTILLGSIAVAASSYLPAVGRPGIVAVASAMLGIVWIGVTAALQPSIGVAAIGIGNLAGGIVEAIMLTVATKKSAGISLYRPLIRPLGVAILSGGLGWLVCVGGPDGLLTAIGAAILTIVVSALGLWITCRKDLADTVRLASGSLRSVLPRLRRTSAQAA